ncbi:MAG TPA: glycosyltransferase family 1 protein [Candidatus Saccharimonadales bacterium]|nr:glycosyltransferase family 1 protein [Candidatus Saccharimonadales bacterium]
MRIAIDARIISTGTGRYIERLLFYLEQLDTADTFLILVRRKDLNYYKPHKPNFQIVEADFADYSFAEQLGFNKLLRKLRPNLVHFCMPQQPLLYKGNSVTTVHDLNLLRITANDMSKIELFVKQRVFAYLLKRVAKRSTHIIATSIYTKNDLINFSGIPSSKITVTYEGTDLSKSKQKQYSKMAKHKFIMYLGRAEPYKNNRGLIKAHQALLKTHPDLWLVIVGKIDKQRQADMEWAKDLGYKQIHFTDFIPDEQVAWLHKHCLAYVLASFMEGFGLPALEAMGDGAPVVSSNTTCLPEIYGDGAYYFDPHNFNDMVAAIDYVISNPKIRDQLRVAGKKVHDKYSWKKMAKQTLEVYKNALVAKEETTPPQELPQL